jgi:hypothetical protein
VRIGQVREESGGERACGGKLSRGPALQAQNASFERRMGAARAAMRTVICAARSVAHPAPMELAERETRATEARVPCDAPGQCYDGFRLSDDVLGDLGMLSDRCARACGMAPLTKVHQGDASESSAPEVYAIDLDAGACYRFFAVADPSVSVLIAAITDAEGAIVAIDNTRDRAPILGPRAPFCPSASGSYRLVVTSHRGAGHYIVQGWSMPRVD